MECPAGGIQYDVQPVPEPDKLSCWAAAMAMLAGYRRDLSLPAEAIANEVGQSLRTS